MRGLETLRELVYRPPSPETWRSITELFDAWREADGLQAGLDYAREHLDGRWPMELRRSPLPWVEILLGGKKGLSRRKWDQGQRAHPGLQLCTHLDLRGLGVTRKKLLKSWQTPPFLGQVQKLTAHKIEPDALALLLDQWSTHPFLHLDLSQSRLEGLSNRSQGWALVGRHADKLRSLCLRRTFAGRHAVAPLLRDPERWASMEHLDLGYSSLQDQGWASLARVEMPALRSLDLERTWGGAYTEGLRWRLPRLQRLTLSLNEKLSADSLATLEALPSLEHLALEGCALDREALATLGALPLPALTRLDLGYHRWGPEALDALLQMPLLGQLTDLRLRGCRLSDADSPRLVALLQASPRLQRLDLSWNRLYTSQEALRQAAPEGLELVMDHNSDRSR